MFWFLNIFLAKVSVWWNNKKIFQIHDLWTNLGTAHGHTTFTLKDAVISYLHNLQSLFSTSFGGIDKH